MAHCYSILWVFPKVEQSKIALWLLEMMTFFFVGCFRDSLRHCLILKLKGISKCDAKKMFVEVVFEAPHVFFLGELNFSKCGFKLGKILCKKISGIFIEALNNPPLFVVEKKICSLFRVRPFSQRKQLIQTSWNIDVFSGNIDPLHVQKSLTQASSSVFS